MLGKEKRGEIKAKIKELETVLNDLRKILEKDNEERQHDAIDHLETYFDEINGRFNVLRNFVNLTVSEVKQLLKSKKH